MSTPKTALIRMTLVLLATLVLPVLQGCSSGTHKAELKGKQVPPPKQVLYVSVGGDKKIAVYDIDASTGQLTQKQAVELTGPVGPLAISPDGRTMYAATRGEPKIVRNEESANPGKPADAGKQPPAAGLSKTGKHTTVPGESRIARLELQPATGELKPVDFIPALGFATYVGTDQSGRFLLSAYYGEGKVAVHAIDPDGKLKSEPVQVQTTTKTAHAIQTDRSNSFAFVPHTVPNEIHQFRFGSKTGILSPNTPPVVAAPVGAPAAEGQGAGPRHYAFHPTLDVVYFVNELGGSVSTYRFDRKRGVLQHEQTVTTLPKEFKDKNTCADIHVTPDGRFVYASNRGHDSLACYSVDAKTGHLTLLEIVPTEAVPRSFGLDATGRFLYAAGQKSGKLAIYTINPDTGKLTPAGVIEVGKGPAWVLAYTLKP